MNPETAHENTTPGPTRRTPVSAGERRRQVTKNDTGTGARPVRKFAIILSGN